MKKKNILLISHDLNVCGAPNSLLRQAKYFKQAGHDVTVWTLADGPLRPRYEEAGFSPVVVNNSYDAIVDAYDKTQKNFDFILCNTIVTYKFVRFFKNITKNLVWFIRETKLVDDWIRENPEFAKEYTSFQNIYTVSEYAATVSKKYNDNIHWFPNAIADNFHEFHKSKSGVTFGYIGSVIQVKGIDLLVNAFLEINKENPDTRLIIAGCEGLPLEQELKKLTKNNKNVVWMGQVQGDEKENFFNNIDVLCVPSLDEPYGLTLLEGAMYGKALITTYNVGAKDLVQDSVNGFIVKPGDKEQLVAAMKKIKSIEIEQMQRESRKQYLKQGTLNCERRDVLNMLKYTINLSKTKIFQKTVSKNGRVRIYFCGIKVASYECKTLYKKILNRFFEYTGKHPTDSLETLNEKIIWAQMFDVTPLKIKCADKYLVRDYVKKTIGKQYLINLFSHSNTMKAINLHKLPDTFVVKYSEGSGKVFLVPNKDLLDINRMKSIIKSWKSDKFWTHFYEMQYKDSAKKILIEEFVDIKIEYKLWMFHGKCQFIKIEIMNDFAENGKPDDQYGKYFFPDWSPADFKTIGSEPNFEISKPKRLDELLFLAEKLSEPFDFVRVDFYETKNGDLKFGELTFSPAAGKIHFVPEEKNKYFGNLYTVPSRDRYGFTKKAKRFF